MEKILKPATVIFTFTISILLSLSVFLLPTARPLTADLKEFSAKRALEHIKIIAKETHPVGSPAQKEARQYIVDTLAGMGLKPVIQTGYSKNDVKGFMGMVPYSGELNNIYTRLEGTGKTRQTILMLAHYDSTLGGPGAGDDASSVAVILETARALLSDAPLMNDIIFLFTDGEEAKLLGSKLFTKNQKLLEDVSLVINLEARGNRGPSVLFETSDRNGWLMKEFKKAIPYPVAYSFTSDIYKMVTNVTDFTSFLNTGKSGFNLANLGGMETYHNPQDTPENLNKSYLQHQGTYALSMARHFGNVSLDNVSSNYNSVYFSLARSLMVLYPEKCTIPFVIGEVCLLVAALWIGFRKKLLTFKGVIFGLLVSLLILVVSAGFGIAVQTLFTKLYYRLENIKSLPELIDLRRKLIFTGNIWIVITMVLSVVIILLLIRLFSRKIAGYNLVVGSIALWTVFTVLSAFCLPGASYVFLWPSIFTLAGLLASFMLSKKSVHKNLAMFVLCTFACVLLFLPVGYLLFESLTMLGAAIPIAILSLPVSLMLLTMLLYIRKDVQLDK